MRRIEVERKKMRQNETERNGLRTEKEQGGMRHDEKDR